MQSIIIVGRLTADAVLKVTETQGLKREFISFTVACNESRGDERNTTYYEVAIAKSGILDYLKKGTLVGVSGNLRFSMSTGRDGKQYPHLSVAKADVHLLDSKRQGEEAPIPGA